MITLETTVHAYNLQKCMKRKVELAKQRSYLVLVSIAWKGASDLSSLARAHTRDASEYRSRSTFRTGSIFD